MYKRKIQFTKSITLESLEGIIDSFSSIFDADFKIVDSNGHISYPKISAHSEDLSGIIQQVINYREPILNENEGVFIQPIWIKVSDDQTTSFPDFLVGAVYISGIKKEQIHTLYQIMSLVQAFIKTILSRNIEMAETVKNLIETQSSLKRLYDSIDSIGKEKNINLIAQRFCKEIINNLYKSDNKKDSSKTKVIILLKNDKTKISILETYPKDDNDLKSIFNELPYWRYEQLLSGRTVITPEDNQELFNEIDNKIKKIFVISFPQSDDPIGLICIISYDDKLNFDTNNEFFIATLSVPVAMTINIERNKSKEDDAWREISFRSGHRISNILFGLKGEIDWLKDTIKEKPLNENNLKEAITEAENSLNEATKIVKELKGFIKPDELKIERVDINAVLDKAIALIKKSTGGNIIKTNFMSLPFISIDSSKTKHVLTELVENACRIIKKGEITISTRISTPEDMKSMTIKSPGDYISIEIKDTGHGIPDENKLKIFQPLFSTRAEGTGLGLAIVKKNIELQGGFIKEIGTPGKGALFLIILPYKNKGEGNA